MIDREHELSRIWDAQNDIHAELDTLRVMLGCVENKIVVYHLADKTMYGGYADILHDIALEIQTVLCVANEKAYDAQQLASASLDALAKLRDTKETEGAA